MLKLIMFNCNCNSSSLNMVCFIIFGTMTFSNQEMLYTAAEDILSGHKIPTAVVLVTFVAPLMVVKIFAPWYIHRLPYWARLLMISLLMIIGIVIVSYAADIRVKIIGIVMNAVATGASELVLLSLASFYPQICISAFVAGTGLSSLISPLYYTGKFS